MHARVGDWHGKKRHGKKARGSARDSLMLLRWTTKVAPATSSFPLLTMSWSQERASSRERTACNRGGEGGALPGMARGGKGGTFPDTLE